VARVLRLGRFSHGCELRERGESIRFHKVGETENEILSVDNPLHAEYATPAGPFFELTWRSACHHFLPDRSEHQAAYNPSSEYGFVAVGVPVEGAVRELIRLTELEEIAYEK
jgi:hypothetical protein